MIRKVTSYLLLRTYCNFFGSPKHTLYIKGFGVLTALKTMHPSLALIYRRVEIFEKSQRREHEDFPVMEDMHCCSFVTVYRLSSSHVLYSTSNQFLYVNKNIFSTLSTNFIS